MNFKEYQEGWYVGEWCPNGTLEKVYCYVRDGFCPMFISGEFSKEEEESFLKLKPEDVDWAWPARADTPRYKSKNGPTTIQIFPDKKGGWEQSAFRALKLLGPAGRAQHDWEDLLELT